MNPTLLTMEPGKLSTFRWLESSDLGRIIPRLRAREPCPTRSFRCSSVADPTVSAVGGNARDVRSCLGLVPGVAIRPDDDVCATQGVAHCLNNDTLVLVDVYCERARYMRPSGQLERRLVALQSDDGFGLGLLLHSGERSANAP